MVNINKINGFYVPTNDKHIDAWKNKQKFFNEDNLTDIKKVINQKKIKTALDIGAWCGLWSWHMKNIAKTIHLFEPNLLHMECAKLNLENIDNIVYHSKAIGSKAGSVSMEYAEDTHTQTYRIKNNNGDIPCITIDSLELIDVDLIKIDVEGYELHVLKGAEKTIQTNKPIIQIEYNGNTENFGSPKIAIHDFLTNLGMTRAIKNYPDCIYKF